MTTSDCRNELAMQARRRRISPADQARLAKHLASCESCRLDAQVGADFDRVGELAAGYEVTHSRLADGVVKRFRPPRIGIRRNAWWIRAGIAAVLVAASAAASSRIIERRRAAAPGVAALAIDTALPARPEIVDPIDLGPPLPPDPIIAPGVAPGRTTVAAAPHRHSAAKDHGTVTSAATPVDDATAASLFERATVERRKKQDAAAIELFADLQRRYPASGEARVARVSLGRLLLDHGMSTEAIAQFDAYLSNSGDGSLVPEALLGRARALEAAGRGDEARATWRRLLEAFPSSVYAPEAKQRLAASP